MAKVLYYNDSLDAKVFEVLKENADGTVDIGTGKTVAVRACKLVVDPKAGHAVKCLAPGIPDDEKKSEAGSPKSEGGGQE